MKIKKYLIATILILGCSSCNKVFFADKATILHEQDGYIFEQKNQMIFVPLDINFDFFSQITNKKGYRIYQAPGYDDAKYAQGDSAVLNLHYLDSKSKSDAILSEKVHLVRVKVVYTENKKSLSNEKAEIRFDFQDKLYSFTAYANRYLQVYQVVGVISKLDRK
ncbi:hypothetical protein [Chitinophaga pinensis]|nr:hypothetical protein [Chitinophaga pinensis]